MSAAHADWTASGHSCMPIGGAAKNVLQEVKYKMVTTGVLESAIREQRSVWKLRYSLLSDLKRLRCHPVSNGTESKIRYVWSGYPKALSSVGLENEAARASATLPAVPVGAFLREIGSLPRWERSGPPIKAIYAAASMVDTGEPYLLTLRVDAGRIAEAFDTERGPVDHLRREIARRLKQALGATPDFWLMAEQTRSKADGLHFHGMIDLSDDQLNLAKEALLDMGAFYRPRKLDLKRPEDTQDSLGWAVYATKTFQYDHASLSNCPLTMTAPLKRQAAQLYQFHRALVLGYGGRSR